MRRDHIAFIIVNWNGMAFLPDCFRSIVGSAPALAYEVVVVDNVSTDGSREWLVSDETAQIFPNGQLRTILSDENLGFGRANNLAIRETDSEFVFILNPDTTVRSGAVDR